MNSASPDVSVQTVSSISEIRWTMTIRESQRLLCSFNNSDNQNTAISFTATSSEPETFVAVLSGVAASSLQALLSESAMISPPVSAYNPFRYSSATTAGVSPPSLEEANSGVGTVDNLQDCKEIITV